MVKKSQAKFVIYFGAIFIVLFVLLYSAGMVPESIKVNEGDSLRTLWDKAQSEAIKNQLGRDYSTADEPVRIVIDKIGVDSTISNPKTTNVATLDEYLKKGAVRYPASGLLGVGNMFIFGHSTGQRVVNNQAYRAFNGLNNLQAGDIIKVYSDNRIYNYKVSSVVLVSASKALVEFNKNKNMLTLSTCTTFGEASDRYVVEADYLP